MKTTNELRNEVELRKYNLTKFLINVLIGLTGFTCLYYLASVLFQPQIFDKPSVPVFVVVTVIILFALLYSRLSLLGRNYKFAFAPILILGSLAVVLVLLTDGLSYAVPYLLIMMLVIATGAILSVRAALMYTIVTTSLVMLLAVAYGTGILEFPISENTFVPASYVIYVGLIAMVFLVVKIAFGQMDDAYQRAYDYATELEMLNAQLDEKVELRTKQLEQSFKSQADSLHAAAMLGGVTKSILHDIASPLSSLKGVFSLIESKKFDADTRSILASGEHAVEQVIRIVTDGKNLVAGQRSVSEFSPATLVDQSLFAVQSLLRKDDINVDSVIPADIKITGVATVFERIVINILLNAIEELRQCDWDRKLKIAGRQESGRFVLEITDNGRGISEQTIKSIFEEDFSLKTTGHHLGFGLHYVRQTIREQFRGEIEVESKLKKFTTFRLSFSLESNPQG